MTLEELKMELRDSKCRLEGIINTIPKSQRKPIFKRIQRLGSWMDTITFIIITNKKPKAVKCKEDKA